MYTGYYHLKKKPFEISPDPKFAWIGEKHAEAIAIMEYGIKENSGFIMLTGDVGVGKTLMVNCLLKRIGSDIIAVKIANPKMAPVDFFNFISAKLGWEKRYNTKGKFLLHFENYLYELYAANKKMLLIIDEAQKINDKLLEEIRLLSNIELEYKKLVNIFIVGQKEFESLVKNEKNKSLRDRIAIWYSIEPLSENETELYIKYRLKIAGSDSDIFKPDAIQKIHFFSNGLPRRINILCDRAMLTGFTSNMKEINSEIIEECAHHLRMISDTTTKEKIDTGEKADRKNSVRPITASRTKLASASRRFTDLSILILIIIAFFVYTLGPWNIKDNLQRLESKMENKGIQSVRQAYVADAIKEQKQVRNDDPVRAQVENDEEAFLEVPSRTDKDSVDMKSESYYPKMNLVVYLEHNLNELNDKEIAKLDRIVDFMTYNPNSRIEVKGYTDNSGRSYYDSFISDMRANIIKTYLENKGVHRSRIKATGLGTKNPIASNETQEGRRLNRRVEIEFYNKKPM